mgnify:FL=1
MKIEVGDLVEWKASGGEDIGIITEVNGKWVKVIWSVEPQHSGDYRIDHEQMELIK